jgi:DNA-binding transcriptional LysR family regulator
MDVRQLRYFVALAEELHFGRAAARLHIAQPALSQQIRSLEDELGLLLFERSSRGVALTFAGMRLEREARSVLRRFDEAAAVMRRIKSGELDAVRIGVFPGPLRPVLPPVLAELRRQRPEIEVETRSIASPEQPAAIVDGVLDVAVMPSLGNIEIAPPLAYKTVARERLGIAISEAHPSAPKLELDAGDLLNMPFVMLSRATDPDIYDSLLAALRAAGVEPRSTLEATSPESSLSIVAAGLAVSVKAESEVEAARSVGEAVVWRPLARLELELALLAVWNADRERAAVRLLLDLFDKPGFSADNQPVLDTAIAARLTADVKRKDRRQR